MLGGGCECVNLSGPLLLLIPLRWSTSCILGEVRGPELDFYTRSALPFFLNLTFFFCSIYLCILLSCLPRVVLHSSSIQPFAKLQTTNSHHQHQIRSKPTYTHKHIHTHTNLPPKMSSRFTAPVSKLTRCISTSSSVAAPSHLLSNGSKAAAARSNRQSTTVKVESEESTSEYSTFTSSPTRPILPSSNQPQLSFRFMQTFHHSAPRARPAFAQTVDHLILPSLDSTAQSDYYIRVPLLPDTSFPSSSVLQPEATDAPLAKPEILVIAANPEQVLPAALTEVEGMGVDGVELKFAHQSEAAKEESWEVSGGMIKDLWRGLVEDVMGPQST
ncbi:hypothetical protein QBC38DRAFT_17722 [Podospora fimiseda]|uniref:Uncharacterized protein n=1 Tax=Podospora fimiseda TaxID=252190 RepID=A0AAN7BJL6_9PEZI|nr:hypothetical protein QBC38DRAFT_17722 [Podospora fimiseda]